MTERDRDRQKAKKKKILVLGGGVIRNVLFYTTRGPTKNPYTCSSYNIIVTTISCKQLMTVTPIRKVHFSTLINK